MLSGLENDSSYLLSWGEKKPPEHAKKDGAGKSRDETMSLSDARMQSIRHSSAHLKAISSG